ncbi:hypothetical protein J2X69_000221 [Algoriphagus sp. 4150]|uniref:hypothetical protein n=1 Tax=Algoriphagus sp. 4150 TaxID=2817756 RepID=UPI00285BF87F|nr:hypothetical protein [Algoriphagus sp. 4150]MDR7127893.1 hypothetical protein [Algoriphagus sp. 4150]
MENNVYIQPDRTVKTIEGIEVEFFHTGEGVTFNPFTVVEDFITTFYGMEGKDRVLQPFPKDVIPRFRQFFFASVGRVECIAGFTQGHVAYESHLFIGELASAPVLRVNYYKEGILLFEHFKYLGHSIQYEQFVQQFAYLSELRLPRSNENILVQNHMGETFMIVRGSKLQIWLIKSWQALMDILY